MPRMGTQLAQTRESSRESSAAKGALENVCVCARTPRKEDI